MYDCSCRESGRFFSCNWFNSHWATGLKTLGFSELGQAARDWGCHVGSQFSPMRMRISLGERVFGVAGGSVVWPKGSILVKERFHF